MSGAVPLTSNLARYDETLYSGGSLRTEWTTVLSHINAFSVDQLASRQRDILRQYRANGLVYQSTASPNNVSRPQALDLMPLVFGAEVWQAMAQGMRQRARLKQALYRDIYGAQRLLHDGVIPTDMLYAHSGYMRDLVSLGGGSTEATRLPQYCCDIARTHTGEWRVITDNCQYPASIGYALENRMVLSRVLPTVFKSCRVQRIATYFKQLQRLISSRASSDSRCVMLSYPSYHPHYFEFAWLSKYLGYALVEPADLTVRDSQVFLKTITGLRAVDTIVRFMDDGSIDPMVAGNATGEGVPGLVEAARRGGVTVINPLGTGVLSNPAFDAILPELCEALLGETLELPPPRTHWMGDSSQREHVLEHRDDWVFKHTDRPSKAILTSQLSREDEDNLLTEILRSPANFIAQEAIEYSVAPSLSPAGQVQKQITIRAFHVSDGDGGFDTMPGGLCLLDDTTSAQQPDQRKKGACKDVWILSDDLTEDTGQLQTFSSTVTPAPESDLPSRIAENVFWLGRYSERLESVLRLMRSTLQAIREDDRPREISLAAPGVQGLLRAVTAATGTAPGFIGRGAKRRMAEPDRELLSLLQDDVRLGSLAHSLVRLQSSAGSLSDRLSAEQLRVFNRIRDLHMQLVGLELPADFSAHDEHLSQTIDILDELLLLMSAGAGLGHENITHSEDWVFTQLGRRLERANQISTTVASALISDRENARLLENLLRLFDSVMTYRSRYRSGLDIRLVLQLLLLDEVNPRSLAYQLKSAQEMIAQLPGRRTTLGLDRLDKLATAGVSQVRLAEPERLLSDDRDNWQSIQKFLKGLEEISASMADAVNSAYFTHTEPRHAFGLNPLSVDSMMKSVTGPNRGSGS